jgi:CubicO group peptidase (beta-lactamase class C family)
MRRLITLIFLSLLVSCSSATPEKVKPAQSIDELKQQLLKILADSHIPGMSLAIVHRDHVDLACGLGFANVVSKTPATAGTRFRIGSTSKAFASLSILKLVNEGKLSLTDSVRKIAPEVWFENKWEDTDPVLVVDLLEHTTGWDDMHFREYLKDDPKMSLLNAFDYDHSSRISRWRPGTREAYCNSGPAVAAYIVEKLTSQRFEDYVQKNFFDPIGMKTATYFEPLMREGYWGESNPPVWVGGDDPSTGLTKLYHSDGKTPFPYWNLIYRPAGSINASANDMATYVQFYLNRGEIGNQVIMPSTSIDRLETPTRSWAAQQGLKTGYGLSSYTSIHEGRLYHGHNGGVLGGITEMAYLVDDGVGYFFSVNAGNLEAFQKIGKTIRAYITRDLPRPVLPPIGKLPIDTEQYAGWYEYDSPREQNLHFLLRILGLAKIHFEDGQMHLSALSDTSAVFVPVSDSQFRQLPKDEEPEPVATAILLKPNQEGVFVQVGNGIQTLKKIPTWFAWMEIFLAGLFALAFDSVLLYAPFWLIGGLFKKRRRPFERAIRLWPLIAVLSLCGALAAFMIAGDDVVSQFGAMTVLSTFLFFCTLVYVAACAASALALWKARHKPIRFLVRWHAIITTVGLCIGALYLSYWGVIGYRPWG